MPTYKDNALNRCHNRVGKEYGMKGKAKKTAPRKRRILPEIPKDKVKVQTRGQKTSAYKAQLSKMPKAVQKVKDTKYKAQLAKMPKAVQKVKDTKYRCLNVPFVKIGYTLIDYVKSVSLLRILSP